MSAEVISLKQAPRPSDYIMVCPCGCASFTLQGDGAIICSSCRGLIESEHHLLKFNVADAEETKAAPEFSHSGNGGEFAERKAKRDIAAPEIMWLIGGDEGGKVVSWTRDSMTKDQFRWLVRQTQTGLDMLEVDVRDVDDHGENA